ncbi:hypothetical protein [Kitasatospora sp. NPDC048407]|uniref:hypothetical protein n=1 Tax=Kitasatospora sp. NPDC048407 TaxID=3364051 RepID=UPI003712E3B0
MKVWPEFLTESTKSSAPRLAVRPRSYPFCAPKFWFTVCAIRSLITPWIAETAGSFSVSMIASINACRSSFSNRRTIIFVAVVAPTAPSSDRPSVNGAAA